MHRLPPLGSIEAFVAAMRSATFRVAAESLSLSPSAFGRRVRTLEAHLGVALFEQRNGRSLPTSAARDFLNEVMPSIDALHFAGDTLRGTQRTKALRLLIAPSLAAEWLMPHLSAGLSGAGIADYVVEVGMPGCEVDPARHDISLLAVSGDCDGRPTDLLATVEVSVVAAPELVDRRLPPSGPNEVGAFDRLDMRFPEGMWRRWSERHSAPMPRDRSNTRFSSLSTMYEAASAGLGVALAIPLIAERRMRGGALRPCFRGVTPLGFDYRIVYRDHRTRNRADVRALVITLRDAAQQSSDTFRKLAA